jgi:hypothetical protein
MASAVNSSELCGSGSAVRRAEPARAAWPVRREVAQTIQHGHGEVALLSARHKIKKDPRSARPLSGRIRPRAYDYYRVSSTGQGLAWIATAAARCVTVLDHMTGSAYGSPCFNSFVCAN